MPQKWKAKRKLILVINCILDELSLFVLAFHNDHYTPRTHANTRPRDVNSFTPPAHHLSSQFINTNCIFIIVISNILSWQFVQG